MSDLSEFSVLLSVYKNELSSNLEESLISIYEAQVVKPNEIILVKDGPLTDELDIVIDQWVAKLPDILKVYRLEKNSGLATALNFGLEKCSYEIVARMDTDDVSLPNRFKEQIIFLDANPSISVLSSCIEEYDTEMKVSLGYRELPLTHSDILEFAKRRNPISHPVVMFRKSAILKVGGYPIFSKAQDYALWSLLLSKGYIFANLESIHLNMRTGAGMMNRRGLNYLKNEYKILKFQKDIGFISLSDFVINICIRTFFRIQPNFIKIVLYKFIKKNKI